MRANTNISGHLRQHPQTMQSHRENSRHQEGPRRDRTPCDRGLQADRPVIQSVDKAEVHLSEFEKHFFSVLSRQAANLR